MEKFTVLCIPISAMGHVNATIGIATALRKRGHKVVFAAERTWKGKFQKLGFEEEVYDEAPVVDEAQAGSQWNEFTVTMTEVIKKPALDGYPIIVEFLKKFFEQAKYSNSQVEKIVEKWKPNLIIEDRLCPMPALITNTAPLIKLCSLQPLIFMEDERLPPAFLGLPIDDKKDWNRLRQITQEMRHDYNQRVNEWLETIDTTIPKLDPCKQYLSTNLNIFMYPKAAAEDYLKLHPLEEKWMRLDYCLREPTGSFEVPAQLKDRPGKLLYLSLGTLGCSLIDLMKRIIMILAKSKHKVIVSKGPMADNFELAENMWGEAFLPQLDLLPHVDLVITHGGNNTFTESLYFGKPMIVLPLFADQHDNAQRAVEMKIGRKFNPFLVEEREMIDAIEELLNDDLVAERVKSISKEMQENNCMDQVIDQIEYVVKHPIFPTITGITQTSEQTRC